MTPDRIIDITSPVSPDLAGWPGDTPYRFDLAWARGAGASVNVGRVVMSIHTGTHVDAPFHFDDAGATVDQLALHPFLGPARVVDVRGQPGGIHPGLLDPLDLSPTPRVLFRTDAWLDRTRFPAAIPVLDPAMPGYLQARGVILVGFDLPSVDPIDSKTLPIHHALAEAGIAILEGLDLARVAAGPYELIALPLRLVGADGAPVRAILRRAKNKEASPRSGQGDAP